MLSHFSCFGKTKFFSRVINQFWLQATAWELRFTRPLPSALKCHICPRCCQCMWELNFDNILLLLPFLIYLLVLLLLPLPLLPSYSSSWSWSLTKFWQRPTPPPSPLLLLLVIMIIISLPTEEQEDGLGEWQLSVVVNPSPLQWPVSALDTRSRS